MDALSPVRRRDLGLFDQDAVVPHLQVVCVRLGPAHAGNRERAEAPLALCDAAGAGDRVRLCGARHDAADRSAGGRPARAFGDPGRSRARLSCLCAGGVWRFVARQGRVPLSLVAQEGPEDRGPARARRILRHDAAGRPQGQRRPRHRDDDVAAEADAGRRRFRRHRREVVQEIRQAARRSPAQASLHLRRPPLDRGLRHRGPADPDDEGPDAGQDHREGWRVRRQVVRVYDGADGVRAVRGVRRSQGNAGADLRRRSGGVLPAVGCGKSRKLACRRRDVLARHRQGADRAVTAALGRALVPRASPEVRHRPDGRGAEGVHRRNRGHRLPAAPAAPGAAAACIRRARGNQRGRCGRR